MSASARIPPGESAQSSLGRVIRERIPIAYLLRGRMVWASGLARRCSRSAMLPNPDLLAHLEVLASLARSCFVGPSVTPSPSLDFRHVGLRPSGPGAGCRDFRGIVTQPTARELRSGRFVPVVTPGPTPTAGL
jgi:hypothetical protein